MDPGGCGGSILLSSLGFVNLLVCICREKQLCSKTWTWEKLNCLDNFGVLTWPLAELFSHISRREISFCGARYKASVIIGTL